MGRLGNTLYKVILYEALAKGAWAGLKNAFRKKRGFLTTTEVDAILKQAYVPAIMEQLHSQPVFLTTFSMTDEEYQKTWEEKIVKPIFVDNMIDDTHNEDD